MSEYDKHIKLSPLSQSYNVKGKTVKIEIHGDDNGGWALEIIDEFNNSTVWEDCFKTDLAALDEAIGSILEEGIDEFIGPPKIFQIH